MTRLSRHRFLRLAAAAAALPALPSIAMAQAWPARPVRILVGFSAGGGLDITARLVGQWLSDRLGQSFVVENRPGADGNIATEAAVNAPADGYTLLLVALPNAVNATLYPKLKFNFIRDIAPVSGVIRVPLVVLINPSLPAKTIPEFIAYAKANPGKINMASAGTGSAPHMGGELFNAMAGTHMVHVPYRGQAPALADVIGGQVQVMFAAAAGTTDYIVSGKLRALGVTTATQAPVLRDLPTVGQFIQGYDSEQWYGIGAPKGTPAAIVERLNKEINASFADATMKKRYADVGGDPMPGTAADFARHIASETEKWAGVIKSGGIKTD